VTDPAIADDILTDTRGRVALITLNRPAQLNALNDALRDALGAALLRFDADAGIGAIVITGGPTAFALKAAGPGRQASAISSKPDGSKRSTRLRPRFLAR